MPPFAIALILAIIGVSLMYSIVSAFAGEEAGDEDSDKSDMFFPESHADFTGATSDDR